jgi:hypothetical protein
VVEAGGFREKEVGADFGFEGAAVVGGGGMAWGWLFGGLVVVEVLETVVGAVGGGLDSWGAERLRGVAEAVVMEAVSLESLRVMRVNSQSIPPCS